jgi:hypothetical protein
VTESSVCVLDLCAAANWGMVTARVLPGWAIPPALRTDHIQPVQTDHCRPQGGQSNTGHTEERYTATHSSGAAVFVRSHWHFAGNNRCCSEYSNKSDVCDLPSCLKCCMFTKHVVKYISSQALCISLKPSFCSCIRNTHGSRGALSSQRSMKRPKL